MLDSVTWRLMIKILADRKTEEYRIHKSRIPEGSPLALAIKRRTGTREWNCVVNTRGIEFYGWEKSHHNGDHYDTVSGSIGWTGAIAEQVSGIILSDARDLAKRTYAEEQSRLRDIAVNKILTKMKRGGR